MALRAHGRSRSVYPPPPPLRRPTDERGLGWGGRHRRPAREHVQRWCGRGRTVGRAGVDVGRHGFYACPGSQGSAIKRASSLPFLSHSSPFHSTPSILTLFPFEQNGLPDAAVEWLFSNPTDPGEDATPSTTSAAASPSEGTGASGEPSWGGSADLPAKYRLKAFINHKGPSVHSGYVSLPFPSC